jgi:hypothetical protein
MLKLNFKHGAIRVSSFFIMELLYKTVFRMDTIGEKSFGSFFIYYRYKFIYCRRIGNWFLVK